MAVKKKCLAPGYLVERRHKKNLKHIILKKNMFVVIVFYKNVNLSAS